MTEVEQAQQHLIRSKEYHKYGRSLKYVAPCGMNATVGIWHPGGIAEAPTRLPEVVKIIRNGVRLYIPGLVNGAVFKKHEKFYLPANLPLVQFEPIDGNHTPYDCIFYQEELDTEREKTKELIRRTMEIYANNN